MLFCLPAPDWLITNGHFNPINVRPYYGIAHLAMPLTPHLWLRFVDDTFVIQKAEHSQQYFHYINTHDPNIQFTLEEPGQDGSLPFLDTNITPGPNGTLNHYSLQKPNTHRSISTLGQQPLHNSQTQCQQHTSIQSQSSFQQQTNP